MPPTSRWSRCWQSCADCLRGALAAGPPAREARARRAAVPASPEHGQPGPGCVEISVRSSRVPLQVGCVVLAGGFAQACGLQYRGSLLPAAVVLFGVGAFAWGLWQLHHGGGVLPVTLVLQADGWILLRGKGIEVEAFPRPCSLRLGSHVLLALRARDGRRLRLLLGPGILSAGDLAALVRWLQRAPASEETGPELLR